MVHPIGADCSASYKDMQAVCMAISCTGKCALISRRSISIIQTKDIANVDYTIKRETKWDTVYSEFSIPHPSLIAITNAQTVQIFNTDDNTSTSLLQTLKGHTRTITDLNWSLKEKTVLATASYDNYMHIWDLRDNRKPTHSMHSIAGATQVKWSKINDYTLATSHEGDVRIWDKRKCNTPIHYITAHLSKINGIDWNPFVASKFVTCSQDGNVKFWDINTFKGKAESTLATELPVWKARYTPFGNGIMTALVPQLRRTGENNSLWLWDMDCFSRPACSYAGHHDVVLDFGWNPISPTDFELITWAKDSTLRLWNVDANSMLKSDSHFEDDSLYSELELQTKLSSLDLNRLTNPPSPLSNTVDSSRSDNGDSDSVSRGELVSMTNNITLNLSQEFSLVNQNIPNIIIEELNANKRVCVVTVKSAISCRLKILFPQNYPYNVIPHFIFINENDNNNPSKYLPESTQKELLKVLQTTATSQVQRNRSCLEKCLRQFIQTFELLTVSNQPNMTPQKTHSSLLDLLPSHKYGSYLDASVPFPRTSGARFCSYDVLVCFGRPPHLEQMNVPTEFTPRSLSALSAYLTSHVRAFNLNMKDNIPSISSFYLDSSRKGRFRRRNQAEKTSPKHKTVNPCGPVSVFSAAKLLPISRSLAEQYWLNCKNDIISICDMNAKIASTAGRRDIFQTWYLVRLSAEIYLKNQRCVDQFLTPWAEHPFGKRMIQSMIEHYALKCNDIQTAAMIACAFSVVNAKNDSQYSMPNLDISSKPLTYADHARVSPPTPDSIEEWSLINTSIKRARSSSWSEYCETNDYLPTKNDNSTTASNRSLCSKYDPNGDKESILDPEMMAQFDYYKKVYADILYRWKLIEKRAQLLKTIQTKIHRTVDSDSTVSFVSDCVTETCSYDNKYCTNFKCNRCNRISLNCIICNLPIKGSTNHCEKCGHGGHTMHMLEWFQMHTQCPTGCGCNCLETTTTTTNNNNTNQ